MSRLSLQARQVWPLEAERLKARQPLPYRPGGPPSPIFGSLDEASTLSPGHGRAVLLLGCSLLLNVPWVGHTFDDPAAGREDLGKA